MVEELEKIYAGVLYEPTEESNSIVIVKVDRNALGYLISIRLSFQFGNIPFNKYQKCKLEHLEVSDTGYYHKHQLKSLLTIEQFDEIYLACTKSMVKEGGAV